MCGICGIVDFAAPVNSEAVKTMAAALAHRGPDGIGVAADANYALGATRLAVLDTSDAAAQPFIAADGQAVLVFNGEIYNYRELRQELEGRGERFRSNGDTEVVLAAYRHWGAACVERFVGMWAFAIFDKKSRRLFASRDRFGIKPFYFQHAGTRLVFGSEPKAFAAAKLLDRQPDLTAISRYLEQGWLDEGERTFFVGLRRLEPGHNLVQDEHGLHIARYWSPSAAGTAPKDPEGAIREALIDSVRLHLRSDVSVGACLSGGIDSSAVVSIVSRFVGTEDSVRVGAHLQTFTAFFEQPRLDERPFAQAVVEQTNAAATWITFGVDDLVKDIPRIVFAQDEPFGSTSIAAQWYVMRAAASAGVTVLLDGQGADESFGGYRAQLGWAAHDLIRSGRFAEAVRIARQLIRQNNRAGAAALTQPFIPAHVRESVRGRLRGGGLRSQHLVGVPVAGDGRVGSFDGLRRQLLTSRGLPELLRYEDRNSMDHSIEARVPFLDHRLVELALALPPRILFAGGESKSVLRSALKNVVPDSILARRDKVGFETPTTAWFRGGLGDLAGDVFASQAFRERDLVDAPTARRLLQRHRAGEIEAPLLLWRALNLELWARQFLDDDGQRDA
ncbi:MAG TPA: asparagine synthase (glutamine-hydrolyzing) [Gaiellaceae bacterium]